MSYLESELELELSYFAGVLAANPSMLVSRFIRPRQKLPGLLALGELD